MGCLAIFRMRLLLALCLAFLVAQGGSEKAPNLQSYNVVASESSVSGLSSGGYMAVQFHVSFSSTIKGAGITAGGPFYCATSSIASCSVSPSLISISALVLLTKGDELYGYIDPTINMATSRVFLISGTRDTIVVPGVMKKLEDYYSHFVSRENIATNFTISTGHGQLTNDYGSKCSGILVPSPYIVNCDYPSGYMILQHIYGDIKYASDSAMKSGNLMEFDQSEFFAGLPELVSMDTTGYVYVPTECQTGAACRLHIAFHGCNQGRVYVGDVFAVHAGYNGVAEVNNIIVLYPQATTSLVNPYSCWDWWGYTGPLYGVKSGLQMAGVKLMLDRIASS